MQYGPDHIQPTCELPDSIEIQYSQAFCHLTGLLDKFQDCISKISPLQEEDLLFLLLRRFADSSNVAVYAEIRRPEDIQVYDSTIQEPLVGQPMQGHCHGFNIGSQESMILEGSLSHDTSVIHANLDMNYPKPGEERSPVDTAYTMLPQTPSEVHTTCAVTVNFPATFSIENETVHGLELLPASPPEYTGPSEWTEISPEHDWAQLPFEFQPPSFRIHRCHHSGVERGGEDEAFELPLGFPEVVQHVEEACSDVRIT